MSEILDMIIVGAGPAGISAAIYAKRAMLNFVILEKSFAGGQIINTYEVENYPGIQSVSGFELSNMFSEHASSLGVEIQSREVLEIDISGDVKRVVTDNGILEAKTIVLSTGAQWRKLGVKGEEEFIGQGVSYCATCDGAFYKGKRTLVVGGGDVAVEDAIYLSRMCEKVYLAHRRNELRAVKVLQDKLLKTENIEILWDTELEEIYGADNVEGAKVFNNKNGEKADIKVSGVFVAVGTSANSELLKGKVAMDEGSWIITDEDCETSVKGVFAVGDVRKKSLKQVITAAADGAIAVYAAEKYI